MATAPVTTPLGVRAAASGPWWTGVGVSLLAVAAAALPLVAVAAAPGGAVGWKAVLAPWLLVVPGSLVALGRPRSPLGWLMLGVALVFAGTALGSALVARGLADGPAAWAVWFVDRSSALIVPMTLAVLLMLPDGRMPSPAWRWTAGVALGAQTALVLLWALAAGPAPAPDTELEGVGHLANPMGILPSSAADLATLLEPLLQGLVLLAVPAVAWRVRRGPGEQRRRLASVLGAVLVFALLVVLGRVLWPAAADLLDVLGCALLALALTSAVVRRRLHGVDVVVSHALVYALLTALVAAAYVVVVAVLGRLGPEVPSPAAGVVSAVVALALLPVRGVLQRVVRRSLFGDTSDAASAIRALAATSVGSTTTDDLLAAAARTVRSSLRASTVQLGTTDGRGARSGPGPAPGAPSHTEELAVGGTVLGRLTVSYPPGRRFGRRDRELVRDVADHVARVVEIARLGEEVRASRQAIVTAREEERLRLRRDLHDELGPTLAGLSMQLGGLGEVIARDPMTAAERAGLLEGTARSALEQVRVLSRGLRPPALDELGLSGALVELGGRCGVEVSVQSGQLSPLPPAVEVAAFRIGAEALANVARHAPGHPAVLVLEWVRDPCALVVEVVDHGPGLGAARSGVGTLSMRERAEELGGSLEVRPTPGGGTTVHARLPLVVGGRDR